MATRIHSTEFMAFLEKVRDRGPYQALYYTGEGDVTSAAIDLANKLEKKGYQLTSYQSKSFRNPFDRCWAIYKKDEQRPRDFKKSSHYSEPFYNIGNTCGCGAYVQLRAFQEMLVEKNVISG